MNWVTSGVGWIGVENLNVTTTYSVTGDEWRVFSKLFFWMRNSTIYVAIFRTNIWSFQNNCLFLHADSFHMYNHLNINNKKQIVKRNQKQTSGNVLYVDDGLKPSWKRINKSILLILRWVTTEFRIKQ